MTEKELNIFDVDINQEMRESYLQYSMSVIVGRALPDVRDGLKPVHRRILFAMRNLKNTHDKPYKKSARVVGDVIGKYHPHGDQAVYDSIVRMAQYFSMRHPLVDGQGNFGSVDGDAPAASRYTEIRMTSLAEALLEDIDKETITFVWNYDDSLRIPQVLPARFPNLLVNGSEGIAVGMASRIPPHNLGEIVSAVHALIKNPDISDEELLTLVPGPDFPTAGIIKARAGLLSAYKTGKGIITVQAKVEIQQQEKTTASQLIVHELPFQVNKARLIEGIASLVKDKKIEGISDIKDESSREGMRIVITLKRKTNAEIILNQLFKHSQLRIRFGIIFLALNAQGRPQLFSLKQMLQAFVEHRYVVVTKRLVFDLKAARQKVHILEGLSRALEHISEVIQLIRKAKDTREAREQLIEKFQLSTKQAQAILDMRLQRLTSLERQKITQELKHWQQEAEKFQNILSSDQKIYQLIETELQEIKTQFTSPRLSQIESAEEDEIETKQLVPKENVLIVLNMDGEIKQISLEEYRLQKRGGVGTKGSQTKGSLVRQSLCASTHSTLLVLTDRGRLYWLEAFRIPRVSRTARGRSIRNLVQLQTDEKVQVVIPVDLSASSEALSSIYLCLATKNGLFKKTTLQFFSHPRKVGVIALEMKDQDQLVSACISHKEEDIFILTRQGYSIRFATDSVRSVGRKAQGVRGISLKKGDNVVGLENVQKSSQNYCFSVTQCGYGKKTKLTEYRRQNRGGTGIIAHKLTDKTGLVANARVVAPCHHILVITSQGQSIRFSCEEVPVVGRSTQGVRLIKLKPDEMVRSASLLSDEESTGS